MEIFCQKHPSENLYFGQMTLAQLQTLMPNLLFSKLKGNNVTVNIRQTDGEVATFSEIEFEVGGNTHGGYGYLTINPDCVDCSVAASSPIGNQADGGEIFNVTFQSFKKKVSVRLTQETINKILEFPDCDVDNDDGSWETAFEIVCKIKGEKQKGNLPTKYTKNDIEKAKIIYKTLEEFRINEPGLYSFAHRNHIPLDFFERIGNKYQRCIYSYTFILEDEKYIYVGLTHDLKERHRQHCRCSKSQVYMFSVNHNIPIPQPKQESDYMDKDDASVQEKNILQNYIEKGYIPLNKATCGGLGGGKVINAPTEEEIREKAKDYTSVTLFRKNCGNLFYTTAK